MSNKSTVLFVTVLLSANALGLFAQSIPPERKLTVFGVLGTIGPVGRLADDLSSSLAWGGFVGYRATPHLQIELGILAGSSLSEIYESTTVDGDRHDYRFGHQAFALLGARYTAELFSGTVRLSGGTGLGWAQYSERIERAGDVTYIGPGAPRGACGRTGWGPYEMIHIEHVPGSGRYTIGVSSYWLQVRTSSGPGGCFMGGLFDLEDPVSDPFHTSERWFSLSLMLSVYFAWYE